MSGSTILESLVTDNLEKVLVEHKEAMKAWDVEDLVAYFINIYKTILDADKRHHERAIKDPSYPYQEKQKAQERSITAIVKATDWLLNKCEAFEKKQYKIKDKEKLKSYRNAFANIDKLFESFYTSPAFEKIHEEAVKEHKAGKTKEWS